MLARTAIIILSIVLAGASAWVVFSLEENSQSAPDPMLRLPDNVIFALQFQPGHNPDFGPETQALSRIIDPQFEEIAGFLKVADSLRQQNSALQSLMLNSPLILSLLESENRYSWMVSAANSEDLFSTNADQAETIFQGFPIIADDGVSHLVLGPGQIQLTESRLGQDSLFLSCYSSANKSGSNLFIKHDSKWVPGELEVETGATNIHFVDFQTASTERPTAIASNLDAIIPVGSTTFRSQNLESSAKLNRTISDMEDSCACDVTAFMVSEISHYTTFDFEESQACALHYPNLLDRLNSFSQLVGPTIEQEFGYPIFRFLHPTFFEALGQPENLVWLTYAHDHLIGFQTRNQLSKYLSALSTGQVRSNQTGTAVLNSTLPAGYTSERAADPAEWFPLNFENGTVRYYPANSTGSYFALSIQNQGYTPTSSESNGPLWASPCDGLSSGPWLVKNHYTNEGEILWQDNSNGLHLISSTGQELWNATIDGQILGAVTQIDMYKNGKLQMIFNTAASIYCLDRNGRLVDNFPIRLPGESSCPLAVVDYDSDLDYRFIQAIKGGEILNYKIDGKKTRGWNFRKSDSDIEHVEHIRIRAKDYVFALENSGEIHLLKRGGGSRYKSKARAKQHRGEDIHFIKGSTIGTTKMIYPDDAGNIVSLQFDQDAAEFGLTGLSSGSNLTMADINDDRELDFLVADGNEIKAYDSNFQKLFETSLPAPITFGPKVFSFSRVDKKIGAVSENQMYLIDNQGNIDEGFPKPGSDGFLIYDLDRNGSMEVIGALNGALVSTGL